MIPVIWRSRSTSEITAILAAAAADSVHILHANGEVEYVGLESGVVHAAWQGRERIEGSRFRFRAHQFRDGIITHGLDSVHHWSADGRNVRNRRLDSPIRSVTTIPGDGLFIDAGGARLHLLSPDLELMKTVDIPPGRVTQLLPIDERETLVALVDRVLRLLDGEVAAQVMMPARLPPLVKYPRVGLARLARFGSATLAQTMSGELYRITWAPEPRLDAVGSGYLIGCLEDGLVTWNVDGIRLLKMGRDDISTARWQPDLGSSIQAHAIFSGSDRDEALVVCQDTVWRMNSWSRVEIVAQTIREVTAESGLPSGGLLFAIGRDLCRVS